VLQTTSQLVDAYKALMEIVKENPKAINATDPDAIRERQFAAEYLDETPNSARSVAIKKRIIDGSRSYLEKRQVNTALLFVFGKPLEDTCILIISNI
jgi:nuclear pore complex protein Nup93